jgi:CubicO group peptidase (beta-lactamase class C family)
VLAPDFRKFNDYVRAARDRHGVPGVACGMIFDGRQFTSGHGITNVNAPIPVDADTLFQTGSVTKTYTATLMMILVEQGKVDLDAPVRKYLPDFKMADESVAAKVTVRQTLNHTCGWFGEYFGRDPSAAQPSVWPNRGDDAVARYVADMVHLPQLAPPGLMFSYNNAALVLAGRIIEVVTGMTYEAAMTTLLLKPLCMDHSFLFPEEAISYKVCAGHNTDITKPAKERKAVVNTLWVLPRATNAAGALIISIADQLKYAQFHLGDGRTPDGKRLLSSAHLVEMRKASGPGLAAAITGNAEVYGVGVGWMLERLGGVQIVTHNGGWVGQESVLVLVPERNFAVALLTNNAPQGSKLHYDVTAWALKEFLGLSAPLPPTVKRSPIQLAEYAGFYGVEVNVPGGGGLVLSGPGAEVMQVAVDGEGLTATTWKGPSLKSPFSEFKKDGEPARLAFFRDDAVLVTAGGHTALGADFVRDSQKRIGWFRWGAQIQPRLPDGFGK